MVSVRMWQRYLTSRTRWSHWCGWASRCLTGQPARGNEAKGLWRVSSLGRCADSRGVISYGYSHPSGYRFVKIRGCAFCVHRLVALAFLGPSPSQMAWQVHHRDGDPSNNDVDNLEYVTHSQNMHYSFQNPLRGRAGPFQAKPVRWRKFGCKDWTISSSIKEAASLAGVSPSTVSKCCGRNKHAMDHEFLFAQQNNNNQLEGEEWRALLDPQSGKEVPHRKVSSMGRVTFLDGRISAGTRTQEGYFRTKLFLSNKSRSEFIHRLVAFAFLGPPPSLLQSQVNHRDLDKGNNAVDNLEWSSASQNLAHCWANQTMKRSYGKAVESRQFGSKDEWEWHPSITVAAEVLQVWRQSIANCTAGRQAQAGGYEFRLAGGAEPDLLPGEEWKVIDLEAIHRDRLARRKNLSAVGWRREEADIHLTAR